MNTDTYNSETLQPVADPSPEMLAKAERVTGLAHRILSMLNEGPLPDIDDAIDACCSALAYLISGLTDEQIIAQYNLVGEKVAAGIALQKQLGFTPKVAQMNAERAQ